jgi:DNA-binding NarL/FixJ family response regulator
MRVVIAEDNLLLREGLVALLRERGIDVVAQADDGEGLLRIVAGHRPDLAIVDVRLPPSFTDEGVRAAIEARARDPRLAILILSQYVEPVYTSELLASGDGGIGYLLKERVAAMDDLLEAVERVARGGTAIDPAVVAALVARRRERDPLDELTARERDVLALMAEGRSNRAIASTLVIGDKTVETHVASIFSKLGLESAPDDHRRVLAVLTWLRRS